MKKPTKATDRRRHIHRGTAKSPKGAGLETGEGAPLADLFNNRKKQNGQASRAG